MIFFLSTVHSYWLTRTQGYFRWAVFETKNNPSQVVRAKTSLHSSWACLCTCTWSFSIIDYRRCKLGQVMRHNSSVSKQDYSETVKMYLDTKFHRLFLMKHTIFMFANFLRCSNKKQNTTPILIPIIRDLLISSISL